MLKLSIVTIIKSHRCFWIGPLDRSHTIKSVRPLKEFARMSYTMTSICTYIQKRACDWNYAHMHNGSSTSYIVSRGYSKWLTTSIVQHMHAYTVPLWHASNKSTYTAWIYMLYCRYIMQQCTIVCGLLYDSMTHSNIELKHAQSTPNV